MKLNLKILEVSNVTQSYVDWFLNPNVTRYSDNQYRCFTLEGQKLYVSDCLKNDNIDLYGIFDNKHHIGNIAINGLKSPHKCAELTYVIGNTNYWAKGVGTFAISNLINLSKNKYKLNKLFSGLAKDNIGSRRVLEKNGFILEGVRSNHLFYNGNFCDQLDFGLILK